MLRRATLTMMFKERWAFVVGISITIMIVYMLPLGSIMDRKCQCPKTKCATHEERSRDFVVYSDHQMHNQSLHELRLLQRSQSRSRSGGQDFQKEGWILDCVTWNPKWESPTLDAEPHIFSLEELPREKIDSEDHKHREKTFDAIFQQKDWPANDPSYSGLKVSGPGAMIKNAQGVMAALHVIITKLKQHLNKQTISLLDLPCGDMQWMHKFLVTRNDVEYTGMDIVPGIIEHHIKKYDSLNRVRFIHHDIVKAPVNDSYDLILCRDMLQHLWKADALRALDNFSRSNSAFLLATTFMDSTENRDVEKDALGGRKASYNLELPPFSLAPPICSSYDWNVEHLSLWPLPLKQKYDV